MSRRSIAVFALAATCLAGTPVRADPVVAASDAASPSTATQRPNVLVWMMDDVGFAQLSCYGGLVATPNIDRVARMGLRYANYHTAPICSATRASFLTGRMPHSVHIGGHATAARAFPGYDAHIPPSAGTIAANLHEAGYATFALGKWDHLPSEDASPAGPFTYWATGQGFDRFYGFLAADADNWNPILIRNTTPIAKPDRPDYHLSADLADQAIGMIDAGNARDPARPFFMYWATGAAHAPHHAPKEWIERYRGKFDMGWDRAREDILRREIAQGLVPKDTRLAPRPEGMPEWASLTARQKRLYAHQMEVFAAALSYADAQFGRILDHLEASGKLANTMVVIVSDNGASAEGGPDGLYNEAEVTAGHAPSVEANLAFYDRWGGPQTYPHYSYGWAVAGDTPFRYYKQTTHEGGTRVPLIIAWPRGIAAHGGVRNQFVHVSDIAPTIMDAAGVNLAPVVNNVPQTAMEGQSVAASFATAGDPRQGRAQYVEMYGNKGLWQGGWSLVTTHRFRTWDWHTAKTFDEPWELYDLVSDPGQTRDLAARQPARVAEMARLFDEQAKRFNVYPIHNLSDTAGESAARARADFARRGGLWRYPGVVGNIPNSLAPPVNSLGFRMRADLVLPASATTGPIFAYGGQMGGIGFYLQDSRPVLVMSTLDGQTASVRATEALRPGAVPIALELAKGEVGPDGKAAYRIKIRSGSRVLAEKSLRFAIPAYMGISETFGIGVDNGSSVLAGARADQPFPGRLSNVEFAFAPGGPPDLLRH